MKFLLILFIVIFSLFNNGFTIRSEEHFSYSGKTKKFTYLQFYAAKGIIAILNKPNLEIDSILTGPFEMCIPSEWTDSETSKVDEHASFTFIQSNVEFFKDLKIMKVEIGNSKKNVEDVAKEFCKNKKLGLKYMLKKRKLHDSDIIRRSYLETDVFDSPKKGKKGNNSATKKDKSDKTIKTQAGALFSVVKKLNEFFSVLMKIPIMKKFRSILKCLSLKEEEVNKDLVKKLKNFLIDYDILLQNNFKKSIPVLIEPLCLYTKFNNNIDLIIKLLDNPTDEPSLQWSTVGTFIGETVNILGSS